uniref:Uncharacterized protein n=1 Tax=Oryza meridionalis TaxID=40149 RepID=A0A0E0DS53_9ORYZ
MELGCLVRANIAANDDAHASADGDAGAAAEGGGVGAELRVGEADEARAAAGGVPVRRERAVAAPEPLGARTELVGVGVGVGLPLRRLVGGWVVITRSSSLTHTLSLFSRRWRRRGRAAQRQGGHGASACWSRLVPPPRLARPPAALPRAPAAHRPPPRAASASLTPALLRSP